MKHNYSISIYNSPSHKKLQTVKEALVQNNLIEESTPLEMLSTAIKDKVDAIHPEDIRASANILGVQGNIRLSWEDVFLDKIQKLPALPHSGIFKTSNGINVYCYHNDYDYIYHINLQTNEVTKVTDISGSQWTKYIEDKYGNVYVGNTSGNQYGQGLAYIVGNKGFRIQTSGNPFFFKDSKNDIYMGQNYGSSSVPTGIFLLEDRYATNIYPNSWSLNRFYEDDNENIYVCSSAGGNPGIIHIKNKQAQKIYNGGNWGSFFKASNGDLYVASGSNSTNEYQGIVKLVDGTAIPIEVHSENYYWETLYEDSKGNIYASSSKGILWVNRPEEAKIVYESSYVMKRFFEDRNGNSYVTSESSNAPGIVYLDGDNTRLIYDTGYNFRLISIKDNILYLFSNADLVHVEDGEVTLLLSDTYSSWSVNHLNNKVFISGYKIEGLYLLEGKTVTKVFDSGNQWGNPFTTSKGVSYLSSNNSSIKGILQIDGDTVTKIYNDSYDFSVWFEDSKGNVYASGSSYNGIVYVNNTNTKKLDSTCCNKFLETSKGLVYAGGTTSYGYNLLSLNGASYSKVFTKSYWYPEFEDSKGYVYAFNGSSKAVAVLTGTTYGSYNIIHGGKTIEGKATGLTKFQLGDNLLLVNSTTFTRGAPVVLLEEGKAFTFIL
jgi:hypothetical protein